MARIAVRAPYILATSGNSRVPADHRHAAEPPVALVGVVVDEGDRAPGARHVAEHGRDELGGAVAGADHHDGFAFDTFARDARRAPTRAASGRPPARP